jgi:hypothetical protein
MHADLLAACDNEKYSTEIRAALKVGMNLLFSITDNSEIVPDCYVTHGKGFC